MEILLLGSDNLETARVHEFLRNQREKVLLVTEKISPAFFSTFLPDIIISYNYRFMLKPEVFNAPPLGTVNLHIGYLPWNRGADPNFWSHAEATPKGVTVHYIDAGVDTGDIIAQEEISFFPGDTLKTSYAKLHTRIQELFSSIWEDLKNSRVARKTQQGDGTFHLKKDRDPYEHLLREKGWDTRIAELAKLHLDHYAIHARE